MLQTSQPIVQNKAEMSLVVSIYLESFLLFVRHLRVVFSFHCVKAFNHHGFPDVVHKLSVQIKIENGKEGCPDKGKDFHKSKNQFFHNSMQPQDAASFHIIRLALRPDRGSRAAILLTQDTPPSGGLGRYGMKTSEDVLGLACRPGKSACNPPEGGYAPSGG